MIIPGLVSVTFRQLSALEVIDLTAQAGLTAIEWGGDVHVPAGELDTAERIRAATTAAGLMVEAYGSYYKAGHSDPAEFDTALRTADALGAPLIRVWAGVLDSADASPDQRAQVVDALRRSAELAAEQQIRIAVEYHTKTLTDTLDSALRLFSEAGEDTLVPYWQPREEPEVNACLAQVNALLPRLSAVHVFSWGPDGFTDRLPLADREDLWRPVLAALGADDSDRFALLEFVPDDDPAAFRRDAATLLDWVRP